ncbi:MAG TPA: D-alanyl-D-alanine carboxypeptidase/D-alanyl-D-alanine-endopeptidase [Streptosporangiaceae bacterium]|jgi:D-alanyl-D-alanine carboxypeptidase/D-alanyl-D-alanine-endopeptidase (penicillin-binding protein 4)
MPKSARRGAPGRTRLLAIVVLALLNLLTIGAGGALAGLLPARLALWKIPSVAGRPLVRPAVPLPAASSSGSAPTAAGLSASLSGLLSTGYLGPHVTAVVADLASGKVLFSKDGESPSAPASTTKLATAVASLDTLGPGARFSTRVMGPAGGSSGGAVNIVLVGGGDPTLAAGRPPAADYPQPATLQALAAATARSLRARHHTAVRLSYDTAMYSGPGLGPGWSDSYVTTGNVTPISALEVDQGRLLPDGLPQDADDPDNLNPRTFDPAGDADAAFQRFLIRDGVKVSLAGQVTSTRGMAQLAAVSSPPLSAMAAQMLTESNNVIAENLARHVAIALGLPATFSGAARAVTTVASRLGAGTGIHLVDGSGLSPYDRIPAATLVKLVSLAASPAHPQLRPAITGLPVAGFSGTLSPGQSVFGAMAAAARGVVRAKTGNLDTVVSLAGLVEDRNGTVLTFAFMADQIPGAQDLEPAAGVVDRLAETLAGCGCG